MKEILIASGILVVFYLLIGFAATTSNKFFDKTWKEFKESELDETKSDKKNKALFWYKTSLSLENFSRIYLRALVIGFIAALIEQGLSYLFS